MCDTSLFGIIIHDKPPGVSSARAVAQVKRLLPRGTRIGHAGTLDPFATGVLLLLVGKATKQCASLMNQPKQYETTIKLGATTATFDPESPEQPTALTAPPPDLSAVQAILPRFVGTIQQVPPVFSAMKVGGRRAYDLARKGHDVQLQPRPVHVYSIDLLDYQWPLMHLRIDCGRGTYVRALARDIGEALGVGGYLTALRRTRVGAYDVAQGVSVERLQQDGVRPHLQPVGPGMSTT